MDSYEKKYKDALKRAKDFKEGVIDLKIGEGIMDYIFPELKESEDEKTRKSLISYLHGLGEFEYPNKKTYNNWLVWLEKQGEQKPTDSVEPKFKVGDWCIDNEDGTIFQIVKVLDNTYTYKTNEGKEYSCTHYSLENDARLWTIQDAKQGDVLARTKDILSICIFSRFDGINDKFSSFLCRCGLEGEGLGQELSINGYHDDSENYVPATKEQRDLLFSKIKEAGYVWNAEKKELKKIEENSSDKVEPKFKKGQWIVWQDKCYKVNDIGCGYELIGQNGLSTSLEYSTIDKNAHLWDITKDTKDGDVLAEDTCIFIIKKLYNDITAKIYCCLFDDGDFDLTGSTLGFDENSTFPATKEQRDFLLKEMYMRGYIFDFEKKELKELKKIEKNLDDKDEPKFKAGDWIVHNGDSYICQIKSIREDEYCVWPLDSEVEGYLKITDIDNKYHLWTIKDAKDGDVLAFDNNTIVIFKDLYNKTTFHSYCHIEDGVFSVSTDELPDWWEGKGFVPAIREKRNLLFQKMKEAGYEWDAEKKELKKIEKNPSWSEEDEKNLNSILSCIKHCQCEDTEALYNGNLFVDPKRYDPMSDWLKSLRPQNKHAYNPYKAVVESIAEMCKHYDKASHSGLRDFYDNVKVKCKDAKEYDSLFPQNAWKPSDEQMKAIEHICDGNYNVDLDILDSIYKDFKKLREE